MLKHPRKLRLSLLSRGRRLNARAFLLSALLSAISAPPVQAQDDAPIHTWDGTVAVSHQVLEIVEGQRGSYNLWLTRQPAADGWFCFVHADGSTRPDHHDDPEGYNGIKWTPSIGWNFNVDNTQNPNAATRSRSISIEAVEDADKQNEVIEFTHEVWDADGNCPPRLHGIAKVTVRVIDDDGDAFLPSLSIGDAAVVEGGTARFEVRMSTSRDEAVTVDFQTADGTAVEGDDYTSESGTLTFAAGQTVRSISVSTVEDSFHEPEERFRVTLRNPSGATLADATGEGIISDDDQPEISIGNASVREGETARFEVRLSPSSTGTVTVAYATADDSAVAPGDYTSESGILTFTSGQTVQTISVTTMDDSEQESTERFMVTLSNASGARLIDASAEGTIRDDDGDPDMPELSIGNASVQEGATARFEVRLSPAATQEVTVAYATADDTAIEPDDYTSESGTLTFTVGQTVQTISVATIDDSEQEFAERFMVTLSNPSPFGVRLIDDTGEGTITDNDGDGGGDGGGSGGGNGGGNGGGSGGGNGGGSGGGFGPGDGDVDVPVNLSIDDASVEEGGTAEFVVSLTAEAGETVTVDFETVDGTAEAGSDYTADSGTLTFAAGETTRTISVSTLDDSIPEVREGFTVVLSNPSGAVLNDDTGEGTITDNDGGPTMPELSIGNARVVEGESAQFEVRLNPAAEQTVTVAFATVDDTAVARADYTPVAGRLTFPVGETTRIIFVPTLDDGEQEAEERFTVMLSSPSGAMLNDDTGEGTIIDNDHPAVLAIDDAPPVVEGGTAEFAVRLIGVSGAAVTVDFQTVDGTAEAGSDYTAASGSLTFAEGETVQTISVPTLDDGEQEADESFLVILSNPSGAVLNDDTGEGTIIDNDTQLPALVIDDAPPVVEGGAAEFPVRLSASSGRVVTVGYRTVDGTAQAGSDYTETSGRLRFEPGETALTISVALLDDAISEEEERFTVELREAVGATVSDGTATGRITDNDEPPGLAIEDAPAVVEGGTAEFPVRLDGASGRVVTVGYRTVDGTAQAGSDYTAASGTVTFQPGETVQTLSVAILDDEIPEAEESFAVELGQASGAAVSDGTATGRITDNDELPGLTIEDAPSVSEGDTAEFPVRLDASSGRVVTVSYRTVDGTALAGSDYTAASGTLSFQPGETSGVITVTTLADDMVEATEQFSLELSDPVGITLDDDTGVGTITDDVERRIELVNRTVLPEIGRALAFSAVRCRMDQVISGITPPGAEEPIIHLAPYLVPTSSGWTRTGGEPLPLEQVLGDPSFLIPSRDDDGGTGRFAAWGCGNYNNLSGGGRDGAVDWNGGIVGVHVGADVRIGSNLLAGLSISRSTGEFDYHAGAAGAGGGVYDVGMTGVHPYLAWSPSPDLDIWATVGHARGEITITDEVVGDPRTSGATLDSGLVGFSGLILANESTRLRLKGEAALAQLDAEGDGGLFTAMTAGLRRLRLGTEASHDYRFAGGGLLTPWGEVGVRHDGGDGETGAGLELGGGLRYRNPAAGWSTEGFGRWLAVHQGARQEWGFGARIRYAPRSSRYGPSVTVAPSWGDTTNGMQRLWEISAADPAMLDAPATRLDTRFGYGISALQGRGVLTPYTAVGLARGQGRRYRMGGRMAVGRSATISLETERRIRPAGKSYNGVRVRGVIRF